jgi:hypothetical protein
MLLGQYQLLWQMGSFVPEKGGRRDMMQSPDIP